YGSTPITTRPTVPPIRTEMSSPAVAISANASFARRSRISANDVMNISHGVCTKEGFAGEDLKNTQRLRYTGCDNANCSAAPLSYDTRQRSERRTADGASPYC